MTSSPISRVPEAALLVGGALLALLCSLSLGAACEGERPREPKPPAPPEDDGPAHPASSAETREASATNAPDRFDDAVVICDVTSKGPTHQVLLPGGEALVVREFGGMWQTGRGRLGPAARKRLWSALPALFALPPRMERPDVVDGIYYDFRVATPETSHSVYNHAVPSDVIDTIRDTCAEVFGTIELSPGSESSGESLKLLRRARQWALGLASDDPRRALVLAWFAPLETRYAGAAAPTDR